MRLGLRLAAVAEDHTTAQSLGVSVRQAIAVAWTLGTLVATTAAIVLLSGNIISLDVSTIGFKALPVALLGGLESIRGAPLAGLLIGIGEALAMTYLDPVSNGAASGLMPFIVMIAVLLVRPQGLFGWKKIERL
jgi:branched-chain amino acid transport system permease protein